MNLRDKRIGKTEINNFFRAIAYYIKDPQTFYNFSLVNKLSNSACKEFKAMKIYEFSEEVSFDADGFVYTFKFLPNGWLHGLFKTIDYFPHSENDIRYYSYGKLVTEFFYSCYHTIGYDFTYSGKVVSEIRETTEFFLKSCSILVTVQENKVNFHNTRNDKYITGEKCDICSRIHKFYSDEKWYGKDCYEKGNYRFSFDNNFIDRKRNIIKSVIQYAKYS